VVHSVGVKTSLADDRLIGEFHTVMKPRGKLFGHVAGLGGSTVLGSGDVALILDVPVLVSAFESSVAMQYVIGSSPISIEKTHPTLARNIRREK